MTTTWTHRATQQPSQGAIDSSTAEATNGPKKPRLAQRVSPIIGALPISFFLVLICLIPFCTAVQHILDIELKDHDKQAPYDRFIDALVNEEKIPFTVMAATFGACALPAVAIALWLTHTIMKHGGHGPYRNRARISKWNAKMIAHLDAEPIEKPKKKDEQDLEQGHQTQGEDKAKPRQNNTNRGYYGPAPPYDDVKGHRGKADEMSMNDAKAREGGTRKAKDADMKKGTPATGTLSDTKTNRGGAQTLATPVQPGAQNPATPTQREAQDPVTPAQREAQDPTTAAPNNGVKNLQSEIPGYLLNLSVIPTSNSRAGSTKDMSALPAKLNTPVRPVAGPATSTATSTALAPVHPVAGPATSTATSTALAPVHPEAGPATSTALVPVHQEAEPATSTALVPASNQIVEWKPQPGFD